MIGVFRDYIHDIVTNGKKLFVLSFDTADSVISYTGIAVWEGFEGARVTEYNVYHTDLEILLNASETNPLLRLPGSVEARSKEFSMSELLSMTATVYKSVAEWKNGRRDPPSTLHLKLSYEAFIREWSKRIVGLSVGSFTAVMVEECNDGFYVVFKYKGKTQLPIKISVTGDNPQRLRDYGEHTQDFAQFVSSLGRSVSWYK